MQKRMKLLFVGLIGIFLASSILACGSSYGHRYRENYYDYYRGDHYQSTRTAYDYGYREGSEHGYSDRRRGYDFEYRHDRRYRDGISRDDRMNDAFREGYKRGYEAGYYGRRY
jgi:hypothetical protein